MLCRFSRMSAVAIFPFSRIDCAKFVTRAHCQCPFIGFVAREREHANSPPPYMCAAHSSAHTAFTFIENHHRLDNVIRIRIISHEKLFSNALIMLMLSQFRLVCKSFQSSTVLNISTGSRCFPSSSNSATIFVFR